MNDTDSPNGLIVLQRGEPSGAFGPIRCQFFAGQCLRNPGQRAQILMVVKESSRFVTEGGMALGVGDHEGWLHTAHCRPATVEEANLYIQQEKSEQSEHELKLATMEAWQHLREIVQNSGEQPWDKNSRTMEVQARHTLRSSLAAQSGEAFIIDCDGYLWNLKGSPASAAKLNARLGDIDAAGFRIPLDTVLGHLSPLEIKLLKIPRDTD